jgi:putative peptidoglycan lipid II flippase
MMVSFFSILTNLALNWIFTFKLGLGHRGLALSVGLVAMINFLILYVMMAKHVHGLETRALCATLVKLAFSGAALATVCIAAQKWLFANLATMPFLPELVSVFATICVAASVFGAMVYLLKVDEIQDLSRLIARKFGRKNGV